MTQSSNSLPVGYAVTYPPNPAPPSKKIYQGDFVSLSPVDPSNDLDQLYTCSHADDITKSLWTYMPYGPFDGAAAMREYLNNCYHTADPLFLTVTSRESGNKCGVVSFLNIVPKNLSLELGHIWYSPEVQRSFVNTETIYLMLCEAFDNLNYRRVEWKCDALNKRSRAAAQRLGFSFEGVFYQHQIVKGRNRNTAWFAILDSDWPKIKANYAEYLYKSKNLTSLREMNLPLLRILDDSRASTPNKMAINS